MAKKAAHTKVGNPKLQADRTPTNPNRKMNKSVKVLRNPTNPNRKMNTPVQVNPKK